MPWIVTAVLAREGVNLIGCRSVCVPKANSLKLRRQWISMDLEPDLMMDSSI